MQCRDCEFQAQPRSVIPAEPFFVHSIGPKMPGMKEEFALYQHEIYACPTCQTHVLLSTEVFSLKKPAKWAMKEREKSEVALPKTS
jgi:hypothetical protein